MVLSPPGAWAASPAGGFTAMGGDGEGKGPKKYFCFFFALC
jgi:hypothetical protein